MYEEIINKMVDKKSVRKKSYKKLSLREKVLSLVVEANKNAPLERRVIPRSALTVMARAEKRLSALSGESKELGVLREVSNFITAHVDTFKAYEYSVNTDLLPVGHPKAISNLSASANTVREKYANWLSSDPMLDDSVRSLVASAHSLEPGTVERKHAFARLRVTRAGSTPTFFKIDSLTALVAAFSFSGGNSSAARRARVALQWRDRRGRWVEMGRGLDFNFRLPNGDIASAGGTYVGVNAARGYSTENGKPVANAGLVEVRGNPNIPDGIYSIESPNATPVKARVPGEALRRAKVKATPSVRKPTAEESQSKDIPNLDDLLKTRVDAPSGWEKQDDDSFLSDDNYKAIPSESGYSLHRLDKDGNTGDKVADASSWAEVQAAAEKDSDDYEKFKESVGVKDQDDEETRKGVEGARAAQKERLAESIFNRRTEGGESLEEVAEDLGMTREQVRKIESDYMRDNPEKMQALRQKPAETPAPEQPVEEAPAEANYRKADMNAELLRAGFLLPTYFPTPGGQRNLLARRDRDPNYEMPPADEVLRVANMRGNPRKLVVTVRSLETGEERKFGINKNSKLFDVRVPEAPRETVPDKPSTPPAGSSDVERYTVDKVDGPNKARNIEDVDNALKFLDAHMNDEGFSESTAMGISEVQEIVKDAKKYLENGDTKEAISSLETAFDIMDATNKPSEGRFPKGKNSAEAADIIDKLITRLEESQSATPPTGGDVSARKNIPFNYDTAKSIALDSSKSAQERYAAIFDAADGTDFFEYVANSGVKLNELDPSIPKGTEIVFADGDGQNLTLRYPDGTYHYLDTGATDENGLIGADHVSAYDADGVNDAVLKDLLDTESLTYARGGFIDTAHEELMQEGSSGPDEPPTPPSGGGVPPKVPSPSSPSTPGLFKEFDVPTGAFQLRTADYEPDGRVDEESTDFTDDPSVIATKYPLAIIINAFTESLIGEKDDSVLSGILDSSIDDDEEPLDLEDVDNVVDTSVTPAGRANGTGAGSLEFNAGAEFVPAEALYNAVFLAGGDPNRVIANAYDAVNGNRNNLDRLHNAAGGVPNAEEAKLVDDIFQEIGQIKDASTPEEIDQKAASPIEGADEDKPLPGELIYNVPINFDNPDYYDIDSNPYPPTLEEPDEFGFTDNPEYIARTFVEADLLEQFEIAITDGTGVINLIYNDEVPLTEGTYQVPAEAVRDALQLQGINTNDVLERIRDESNDFEDDEEAVTPQPEETATESSEASMDGAIDSMRNYYLLRDRDIKPLMYLPADGSIAFKDAWDDLMIARPGGVIQPLNVTEEWLRDPNGAGQAGWRDLTDAEKRAILGTSESAPAETAPAETTPAETAPETTPEPQRFQYPGPKEPGYSPNNTTLVLGGAVVGKGARVVAVKDNKLGTVVAIQNNPEYIRIRFDDGTTAVRSALKIRALSTPDGTAADVIVQEPPQAATDIGERLNRPAPRAPRVARSGETYGVNDESTRPEILQGRTQEGKEQKDYAEWGARDAEIAKAANERVSFKTIEDLAIKRAQALKEGDRDTARSIDGQIKVLVADAFGDRSGMTFGGEFYSIRVNDVSSIAYVKGRRDDASVTAEDVEKGRTSLTFKAGFDILDVSGTRIGSGERTITIERALDENGNIKNTQIFAQANHLKLFDKSKKKKGFAGAYNRWIENWYIANGVERIKVFAAGGGGWEGGFVWAISGYDWADIDDPSITLSRLKGRVRNSMEEAQVDILERRFQAAKLPNGTYDMSLVPSPYEFSFVGFDMSMDEDSNWIGKEVLISRNWDGVKYLNPTARIQNQAINYNQIRNARRRVKQNQNIPNISSSALLTVDSDGFRNNPKIAPYYSQIRDTLRNNRPLGFLSPDAKTALSKYVSEEILNGGESMPLQDALRLRTGLINEYRADNAYSDPFNVGAELAKFMASDFVEAAEGRPSKLAERGFVVKYVDDGINGSVKVTHTPTGQVFYVKDDQYAQDYMDSAPGVTELESSIILRASGMQGIHDVRVGVYEPSLLVMSEAGSTIPIAGSPVIVDSALRSGLPTSRGLDRTMVSSLESIIENLDNPEDFIRMSILDILTTNADRHGANWMLAVDSTSGKIRIFPIDHTLGEIKVEDEENVFGNTKMAGYMGHGGYSDVDAYAETMPKFIERVGSDTTYKIYENEINRIITNLADPIYEPKGFEMDKIIEKWGSYDAFKDAVSSRLKRLITKGTNENSELIGTLRPDYWDYDR